MGQRVLVKTAKFLSQVQEASQSSPRLLESVAGAEWILFRLPEQGMAVRGTDYRSWPIHPEPGVAFKIVYRFDGRQVVLEGLWPVVAP